MEEISLVVAIAMIKTAPGQERSVYSALKERNSIKNIYHAFGGYDFFVLIQAPSIHSMETKVDEIRNAHGVAETRAIVSNLRDLQPINCNILDTGEIGPNSASCC